MSSIERIADRWSSDRVVSGFRGALRRCSTELFTVRELVVVSVVFPLAVLVGNLTVNALNVLLYGGTADVPLSWPISVFWVNAGWAGACVQVGMSPRPCLPPALYAGTLLLVAVTFGIGTYLVAYRERGLLAALAAGTVLILLTNLLQGYQAGYVAPVAGGSFQYYHDAVEITDLLAFVSNFEALQPELLMHSKTHPPGAVLTFYALERAFGRPDLISLTIALVSVPVAAYHFWRLAALEFSRDLATYLTYLFLLVPAVQIYHLASLDALVTACTVAALYYFVREARRWRSVTLATAFLAVVSFLTFVPLAFFLPIFVAYEAIRRRTVVDSLVVAGAIALLYAAVYVTTGYDYVNSFFLASALENPEGFMLLNRPGDYVFTRLEGVVEILVFFTPYLVVLLWRRLRAMSFREVIEDDFALLGLLAIGVLLGLLGAGVFRTGETARAANFVYPFMFLLVGGYLSRVSVSRRAKAVLAAVVFAQTVAMQAVGFYFW